MIAVITADIIDSSRLKGPLLERALDVLKEEFRAIQKTYGEDKVNFKIYRGDSFQGILKLPEDSLHLVLQLKTAVNRLQQNQRVARAHATIVDFKVAIGIGSQEIEREAIAESNGQAFQFSGRTLDEMKNENRTTGLKTFNEDVNAEFKSSLLLLDTITDKWSTASAEVVYYSLKDLKEKEIAAILKISQSAVNQRKKAAGWEAVALLLERYREVINKKILNGK
ncbi:MAG TPA: SatD family protein [Gillisia sp.]|nr:SatD family protein [Gillisia sp.]